MLDAQAAAYGDGLDPAHRHEYMWAVKGHYFTPFYNWPYTFGLLFGIGLFAIFLVLFAGVVGVGFVYLALD